MVLTSDRSCVRIYALRQLILVVPATLVLVLLGVTQRAPGVSAWVLLAAGISAAYFLWPCVAWLVWAGTVSYEIRDGDLVAVRRGRIRERVAIEVVRDIELVEYVDTRRILLTRFPPPPWPRASVYTRDGRGMVEFPQILIWGRDSAEQADRQLRLAVLGQEEPNLPTPATDRGGRHARHQRPRSH